VTIGARADVFRVLLAMLLVPLALLLARAVAERPAAPAAG
jgi:hypothetical protein